MTSADVRPLTSRRAVRALATLVVIVTLGPLVVIAVAAVNPAPASNSTRLLVGFAPWLVLGCLVCLGLSLLMARERRSVVLGVLTVISAMTLLVHGVVTARLLAVGLSEGVLVNPLTLPVDSAPRDRADEVFTYDSSDGGPLRVFAWTPAARTGRAPVLVYVHGGGWVAGRPADRAPQLRWFADRGWLVLAPEYPLSGPSRHLWDTTVPQIGCALAWVADHATDLGGNPSRLALLGDSAGANLAINAAYQAATGTLESTCGGSPARPSAVVGLYAVVDPVAFHDTGRPMGIDVAGMVEDYTGGTPASVPERYRAVSSSTYISPATPRTLLIAAESDQLAPMTATRRFADQVADAGGEISLVTIPFVEHGFDAAPLPDALVRGIVADWLSASTPTWPLVPKPGHVRLDVPGSATMRDPAV